MSRRALGFCGLALVAGLLVALKAKSTRDQETTFASTTPPKLSAVKVSVSGVETLNVKIDAYDLFVKGPLAKVGNERMPFVLFRVLPEVALKLEGQPLFGDPENPWTEFGFFKDTRELHKDWPVPMGFTWGVPSPSDSSQIAYAMRTCASCHYSRVRGENGELHFLTGAPNREFDQHKLFRVMSRFLEKYLDPSKQENYEKFKASVLVALSSKPEGWFFNNQESYDEAGHKVQFTEAMARKQVELVTSSIDKILQEMYEANVAKLKVLEVMQERYNLSDYPRKQDVREGPAGILDSNTLAISSMLLGYNKLKPEQAIPMDVLIRGTAKVHIPSVWMQKNRTAFQLDASFKSIFFRDASAALAFIDSPANLNLMHLEVVSRFIEDLAAPALPPEFKVDQNLVEKGRAVFNAAKCAQCHVEDQRTFANGAVPIFNTLGTDLGRSRSLSTPAIIPIVVGAIMSGCRNPTNLNTEISIDGKPAFLPCKDPTTNDPIFPRVTPDKQGYPAYPLTGIWARAPYLHNGSVPTLFHLLARKGTESLRPAQFYAGTLGYDRAKGGYHWEVKSPSEINALEKTDPAVSIYNTGLDGFSNRGHEGLTDGTMDVSGERFKVSWNVDDAKDNDDLRALVEYLLTR